MVYNGNWHDSRSVRSCGQAFALEQCNRLDEAEHHGRQRHAFVVVPDSPKPIQAAFELCQGSAANLQPSVAEVGHEEEASR